MKHLILGAGIVFTVYVELSHSMAGATDKARFILAAVIMVPTILLACLIWWLGQRKAAPAAESEPAPRAFRSLGGRR